jgi:hypothetical protein
MRKSGLFSKASEAKLPYPRYADEKVSPPVSCRREGIASSVYYKWSKAFLQAGKNGLTRDTP